MKLTKKNILSLSIMSIIISMSGWALKNSDESMQKKLEQQVISRSMHQQISIKEKNLSSVNIKKQPIVDKSKNKADPWHVGIQHQFGMALNNRITMLHPSEEMHNTLGINLEGTLALAVTERNYDTMVIRARLEDVQISIDTSQTSEPVDTTALQASLNTDLVKPYYVTIDPEGKIQAIRLFPDLNSNSASLIRSIAAHLQFVQPYRYKPYWQVIEQDQTGEYLAQYKKQAEGVYEKNKQSYQKIATPEGLIETDRIGQYQLASHSLFEFDSGNRLKSVSATETVSATIMDNIRLETQQDMELSLQDTDYVYAQIAGWQQEQTQLNASKLAAMTPGKNPYRQHQEKLLGDDTIHTLMTALRALDLSAAGNQGVIQLQRRLSALFTVYPESAYQALAELTSDLDLERASILVGALANAETPEAQTTLSEVALQEELDPDIKSSAIALLGLAENPTDTTIDALQMLQESEDKALSSSASLALGSAAESIAGQNPEMAEDIVTALLQGLQNSESDEITQLNLEALGNSGDPRIIPLLNHVLEDSSEEIRASGVEALRFVQSPEAIEIISNTVTQDADRHVRQAAIRAMDYQPIEAFVDTLNTVARHDEDSSVRLQLIDRTGERLSTLPEGQELLAWVAQNDADSNIRKHAQSYVCDFNPEICRP